MEQSVTKSTYRILFLRFDQKITKKITDPRKKLFICKLEILTLNFCIVVYQNTFSLFLIALYLNMSNPTKKQKFEETPGMCNFCPKRRGDELCVAKLND